MKNVQKYIVTLIVLLFGIVCGIISKFTIDTMIASGMDKSLILIVEIFLFLGLFVSILVQVILHELGHCFFGWITGYKFSSFRIFSFMWIKVDGKIKFKRLSLAGTDGQCLMSPPDFNDGNFPYILYNLGGSIFNFVFALVFLMLAICLKNFSFISTLLLMAFTVGLGLALINGIPMRGTVDNDGYNAISLKKNKSALKAFWIQMKIAELNSKGFRAKDMPTEYFFLPNDEDMKNNICATIAVFYCNRLLDEHKFSETQKLIRNLLEKDSAVIQIHKNLLICDYIYCSIVLKKDKAQIELLLDKAQRKFMSVMKNFPSVLRTEYAYALLIQEDIKKATRIKEKFNKIASLYPYLGDIECEQELIEIIENYKLNAINME